MQRIDDVVRQARPRHPCAWVTGACAELADRFGLPLWLIRVLVVVAFCNANWLTGAGYLIVTVALKTRLIDLLPARTPRAARRAFRDAPPDPGHDLQRGRFSALEARLARLEAAVTSDEMKLRARFREIGA